MTDPAAPTTPRKALEIAEFHHQQHRDITAIQSWQDCTAWPCRAVAEARFTPAEALDVERLAEATWNVNKRYWEQKGGEWPASFAGERNQSIWLTEAEAVAAEYARLRSPESDR